MPNTDEFQVNPDFYSSLMEAKAARSVNTNPRYKFFKQTHFTAGDYEQFLEYWDRTSHEERYEFKAKGMVPPQVHCPLYRKLQTDHVIQTFEYIFHKFKKGIFLKIVGGELRVFLPFSKVDFRNEWSHKIKVDSQKYPRGLNSMLEKASAMSGHEFQKSRVHFMMDHWYANNGLVRYEYPTSEGDSGISTLRDMFLCLTRERILPDGEYFLNKRDFPILRIDGKEAYDSLFGKDTPLVSHRHDRYCPILGMTGTEIHADIPIPTWEDWARASYQADPTKLFGKEFRAFPDAYRADFRSKRDTAVFRGASTGMGLTPSTNPRLFFSLLSREGRKDQDGNLWLDAGITKWNCRPRRHGGYYDTFDESLVEKIGRVPTMTQEEQAGYKYILHLPGHSSAYRLGMDLSLGSVVLLYPCPYHLWFQSRLKPYEHFVPLDPNNPNDIFEKIRWCKNHPEQSEAIAIAARSFYVTYLGREALLDTLQDTLWSLSEVTGRLRFPHLSLFDFQYQREHLTLEIEGNRLQNPRVFPLLSTFQENFEALEKRGGWDQLHPRTFEWVLRQIPEEFLINKIEQEDVLFHSRSTSIRKIKIGGREVCVKTPLRPHPPTMTHEHFVAQMGMNRFANEYPFFVYSYGSRGGRHILSDFIPGETLEHHLHHQPSHRVMDFLLSILRQLALLLEWIQQEIGFIHFDLYPWNIMIRENTQHQTFTFPNARITPQFYPVLIDYGKSHILYKNMHHLNVAPFRLNRHQDILSIFISSLYTVVTDHKLTSRDTSMVYRMMGYLGGTSYHHYAPFEHMGQIKSFLRWKKKYSNMLLDEKKEFVMVSPLAFFNYLEANGLSSSQLVVSHFPQEVGSVVRLDHLYSSTFVMAEVCHNMALPSRHLEDLTREFCASITTTSTGRFYFQYSLAVTFLPVPDEIRKKWKKELESREWDPLPVYDPSRNTTAPSPLLFPRFPSHPDLNNLPSDHHPNLPSCILRREEILQEIHLRLHASSSFPRALLSPHEIQPYLQPILSFLHPYSVSYHLSRFSSLLASKTEEA